MRPFVPFWRDPSAEIRPFVPFWVALARNRRDGDFGHGYVCMTRRSCEPEVSDVLRVRVGIRSAPSIGIDRTTSIDAVDAEVKVRTRRGTGAAGQPDDLTPA